MKADLNGAGQKLHQLTAVHNFFFSVWEGGGKRGRIQFLFSREAKEVLVTFHGFCIPEKLLEMVLSIPSRKTPQDCQRCALF